MTATALKITGWDEFVNPDYIEIRTDNGKKLTISKKRVVGGQRAYNIILTLCQEMHRNPKAKSTMEQFINQL